LAQERVTAELAKPGPDWRAAHPLAVMAEWPGRWGMLIASYGDALRDESPRKGQLRSLSRSRSANTVSPPPSRTRQVASPGEPSTDPESLNIPQTGATKSGIISWFGLAQPGSGLKPDPRVRSKSPGYPVRSKSPKVDRRGPAVGDPVPPAESMLKQEVENFILRLRAGEEEENVSPPHVKRLQTIEDQNAWLDSQIFETENKVERRKLFAEMAVAREGASIAPDEVNESTGPEWAIRLHGLETELEHCTDRRREIQDSMEARALALHKQLQQCLTQVNEQSSHAISPADVQEETALEAYRELQEAVNQRNQLEAQLEEVQREARNIPEEVSVFNIVSSNPVVLQLHSELRSLEEHLDELKRAVEKESQMFGSQRFQTVQQQVNQVSNEIYQETQMLNDERVCFESEVQELKNKARVLEDSLDSAQRELYYWREKAEQEQASLAPQMRSPSLLADVQKLRAEHASLSEELESLQREEEKQKRTIEDLNTDMDVLERQALSALDKSLSGEFKPNSGEALC